VTHPRCQRTASLIEAETIGAKARQGSPAGTVIVERLAIRPPPRPCPDRESTSQRIPRRFPDDVMAQPDAGETRGPEGREDLRDLPLMHHRPSDARDQ